MPISRPLSFFLAFNTSFIFLIEQLHDCQTVFLLLLFKGNLNFSLHCQRIILLNIGYLVDSFFSFSISIMSSHIFWPPKFLMIGQLLRMPFTCWAFFLKLTLWLSLSIDTLTLCLVIIFGFILLRIYWSSWMCRLRFLLFFFFCKSDLESFWPLFLQIFLPLLSILPSWIPLYICWYAWW